MVGPETFIYNKLYIGDAHFLSIIDTFILYSFFEANILVPVHDLYNQELIKIVHQFLM